MEICFFDEKVREFLKSLEKNTDSKIIRTLDLLEMFGSELRMPHSKKIIDGLFELRIKGTQEVRVLYMFQKKSIMLLHAFIKKTQKIPSKELQYALRKMRTIDEV